MPLKPISPTERAIMAIDESIRQLRLQRNELVALLPDAKPHKKIRYLVNPATGKKLKVRYSEDRR